MQIGSAEYAKQYGAGELRKGVYGAKVLLRGQAGSLNNFRVDHMKRTGETWETPRHRHNFDQIRYLISGETTFAKNQKMATGSLGYFPEGVPYGPQVLKGDVEMAIFQFGGASGSGYLAESQRKEGYDALAVRGVFDPEGQYIHPEENGVARKQDSYEAVWEHVMGRKLTYPVPRFQSLVFMDPAAYSWVPEADPGVATKHLGTFGERGMRIRFVRLSQGATYCQEAGAAPEILFITEGSVVVGQEKYSKHTAFSMQAGDPAVTFCADGPAELLNVRLHRFDS